MPIIVRNDNLYLFHHHYQKPIHWSGLLEESAFVSLLFLSCCLGAVAELSHGVSDPMKSKVEKVSRYRHKENIFITSK